MNAEIQMRDPDRRAGIDAELVRRLFSYDPISGIITRKVKTANRTKVGEDVGCKNRHGYLVLRVRSQLLYAHRVIWLIQTGEFPTDQIDHINGVRSDNRWENLRVVSNQENLLNRARYASSSSGISGVTWNNETCCWRARITLKRKTFYLGNFISLLEASAARKSAEMSLGFHKNCGRHPSRA